MTKRDLKLQQGRIKRLMVMNTHWDVVLGEEHIEDDLMRPEFWDIVSRSFTPGDIIHVRTDDGAFYAQYYVVSCGQFNAHLKRIMRLQLDETDENDIIVSEYQYKWGGPALKHTIVRASDGERIKTHMASKEDCLRWIAGQSKAA